MKIIHRDCPIAVISTNNQGSAAIGVIRFTGFSSIDVFSDSLTVKAWNPRYSHYLQVLDEKGEVLDEGIGIFFEGPNSFTGENVLELQLHGNPLSLQNILTYFCRKYDFQIAQGGEFTYRAFRNGKLNLSQVEGLDLLLNSSSGFGLSSANKILNNELFKKYLDLRGIYLEMRSAIEISIDFSEDVGDELIREKIKKSLKEFEISISSLYRRCHGSLSDLLTPSVALLGKTNAGKSTLFNALLGKARAIVSDTHGTTRDYVSEFWSIEGMPFKLIDTAGLRQSSDPIEIEGIYRSVSLAKDSFFKVLVINPYQDLNELGQELIAKADAIVLTHLDINNESSFLIQGDFTTGKPVFSMAGPMGADKTGPIEPPKHFGPIGPIFMKERSSGPIEPVKSLEGLIIHKYQSLTSSNPIPIQRHRDLISSIYSKFQEVKPLVQNETDIAIVSHEINMLGSQLDELLGIVNSQEVLDHIFANFCIGK